MKLQLALHLLLLMILQLYHLPLPLSNTSCLFTRCQCLYASCCVGLLYFARFYTVNLKMPYFGGVLLCVCEKYSKPITVQYSTTQPVMLIGYLSYLLGLTNSLSEQNSFVQRGLQFSSVTQSCPTLCDPMDPSMPGLPTNSWSLLKLMSIKSVMPSNHLIHCHPFLLPPSIFLGIRVFSNESALRIRWPNYWSFSFNISSSSEYSGLISFRMDWLDLLAVQGILKSLIQRHSSKASILWCSPFCIVQLSHPYMTPGKIKALTR